MIPPQTVDCMRPSDIYLLVSEPDRCHPGLRAELGAGHYGDDDDLQLFRGFFPLLPKIFVEKEWQ